MLPSDLSKGTNGYCIMQFNFRSDILAGIGTEKDSNKLYQFENYVITVNYL